MSLLSEAPLPPTAHVPADLVLARPDYGDPRLSALLVGPGLGRDAAAHFVLAEALGAGCPVVADADALMPGQGMRAAIATPHEGRWWRWSGISGWTMARPRSTARWRWREVSGMVIVAKGPDTVVAAPDGRWAAAARASSWLSTAGRAMCWRARWPGGWPAGQSLCRRLRGRVAACRGGADRACALHRRRAGSGHSRCLQGLPVTGPVSAL
jgi:hypothetical protein